MSKEKEKKEMDKKKSKDIVDETLTDVLGGDAKKEMNKDTDAAVDSIADAFNFDSDPSELLGDVLGEGQDVLGDALGGAAEAFGGNPLGDMDDILGGNPLGDAEEMFGKSRKTSDKDEDEDEN